MQPARPVHKASASSIDGTRVRRSWFSASIFIRLISFSAGHCSGSLTLLLRGPATYRPDYSLALLVLAVFLPELLAQLRVGFRHGRFANLLGDHVIVTAIGHVRGDGAGARTATGTTATARTGACALAAARGTLATGLAGITLGALTTGTGASRRATRVGLHAAVLVTLAAFAALAVTGLAGSARTVARTIRPGTCAIARRSSTRGPVSRQHLLFRPDAAVKNAQRFIDTPQDGFAPVCAARLRTTTSAAARRRTGLSTRLATRLAACLTTGLCTWLAASATRATHSAATGSASGLPCRGSTTLSGSTRRLRRALRRIRTLPGLLAIGLAVAIGVFARAAGTRSARSSPAHGGIAQAPTS